MIKLNFIPVKMRLPLKFGAETIYSIQIAHVEFEAYGKVGLGETPLSVGWAWPSGLSFAFREKTMCDFCQYLADNWEPPQLDPMVANYRFLTEKLPELHQKFNLENQVDMPHLAALICASAFDIAIHDAFGLANNIPTYETYNKKYMSKDLSWFFGDEKFANQYPEDYFVKDVPDTLPVWHLVGGKDLLRESEKTGS